MSATAIHRDTLGGRPYRFRLGLAQLEELQERTGTGPLATLTRLMNGTWFVADRREPILLGLIGGGDVSPQEALRLVERYVDARPLAESAPLAMDILRAACFGDPDDEDADPGNGKAGEAGTASPSPASTG